MTTKGELSRRLEKIEAKKSQANGKKVFIIDNIGKDGAVEIPEEELNLLQTEAVAKDPDAFVYIIDISGRGQ